VLELFSDKAAGVWLLAFALAWEALLPARAEAQVPHQEQLEPAVAPSSLTPPRAVLIQLTGRDSGVHLRDLDAVRRVNDRAKLVAAIQRAEVASAKREQLSERVLRHPYRRESDPTKIAAILRFEYGPDSVLTRSADAVAAIANAAEHGSQIPLDRVNHLTDSLATSSSQALGLPPPPDLRLRSRVTTRRAGISLSTKW